MPRFVRCLGALSAAVLALLAHAGGAEAQRGPYQGDRPQQGQDQGRQRNVAGEFDYYSLVLSWSPTHCATRQREGYDPQCDRRDGKRYAFVLHGLWPQYERGFPESCPVRGRPFVPQPVIDRMADIMPSPGLVIHEYKKHGTCSGLEPQAYYEVSRQLFRKVKLPERFENPMDNLFVGPDELVDEIVKINPGLRPDMLAVVCGGPGNRLREVRVCFSKSGEPRACGRNEDQRRLCSAQRMFVPPVRSTKVGTETPPSPSAGGRGAVPQQNPLPGPR